MPISNSLCLFTFKLKQNAGEIMPHFGQEIPMKKAQGIEMRRQVKKLLQCHISEPSTSNWYHDVFPERKKTSGSWSEHIRWKCD